MVEVPFHCWLNLQVRHLISMKSNLALYAWTCMSSVLKAVENMLWSIEEWFSTLTWYEGGVNSCIMTDPRIMTSLLRRMEQVQWYQGAVPDIFDKRLDGERLRIARSRLSGALAIETKYIHKVCKKDAAWYIKASVEMEPAKKKRKKSHTEIASPWYSRWISFCQWWSWTNALN